MRAHALVVGEKSCLLTIFYQQIAPRATINPLFPYLPTKAHHTIITHLLHHVARDMAVMRRKL